MHLKRRLSLMLVLIVGLMLALTACGGGAPKVEWTLEISGAVGTPLDVDYADTGGDAADRPDRPADAEVPGRGRSRLVGRRALADIFEQAGVGDFSSVTATAADGYAVEISRDELEGAIVALKKDGDWITKAEPDKGPIRLVCPETPANRWVFQIQKIEVNP